MSIKSNSNSADGVLVASPIAATKNIGDYIQSLASAQFVNNKTNLVEREALDSYSNDASCKTKVIMNSWFMWHDSNWPPSNQIDPLFVSTHISPLAEKMLSPEGIDYLKKYEPIGCRDYGTKERLEKAGIEAYYSSCLTLTLGDTYKTQVPREGVIFVDPFIPNILKGTSPISTMLNFARLLIGSRHVIDVIKLSRLDYFRHYAIGGFHTTKSKYLTARIALKNACNFYAIYKNAFSHDTLMSAEYITHIYEVKGRDSKFFMEESQRLLAKYASAKLVVTSRIHCALPCLGMETPTLFVIHNDMESSGVVFNTPDRFKGLIDFFHVLRISGESIISEEGLIKPGKLITQNTEIYNGDQWREYADALRNRCRVFLRSSDSE